MSIFSTLEVVVRYVAHPAEISPIDEQPGDTNCDIIDEAGEPVFADRTSLNGDRLSVEFGPGDVAVLLARHRGSELMVVRIQTAERAAAPANASENEGGSE